MGALLWKELHELKAATATLSAAFVLLLGLMRHRVTDGASVEISLFLAALAGVVTAALFGSLFWGNEHLQGTHTFLLQLPVDRRRLLMSKGAAGALSMAVVWAWTRAAIFLLPGTEGASATFAEDLALLLFWALVWTVFARLSLVFRQPLTTLAVGGGTLSTLSIVGVTGLGRLRGDVDWLGDGGLHGFFPVGLLGWSAVAWSLWCGLRDLEDRPPRVSGRFESLWRPARRPATSPGAVEWRQKRGWVLLFAILAALCAGSTLLWGTCLLVAGAVWGCLFVDAEEEDGTAFFLYHLPISRRKVALQRALAGLAFGALLVGEIHLLGRLAGSEPSLQTAYLGAWLYLVSFSLGAMVSPWLPGRLVGALLVLLTAVGLALARQSPIFLPLRHELEAILLAAAGALGYWSTVHSPALQPVRFKALRGLGMLLPFWIPFVLAIGL